MKMERFAPLLAATLSLSACSKEQAVTGSRTKVDAAVQSSAPAISASPPASSSTPTIKMRHCPKDMVEVPGRFCIDRYEASMYDIESGRRASPHYHPSRYSVTTRYAFFKNIDDAVKEAKKKAWRAKIMAKSADAGVDGGLDGGPDATTDAGQKIEPITRFDMEIPKPDDWQFEEEFHVEAVSKEGQIPNAFISGIIAREACENADKRLCTEEEWVYACKGEQQTKFPYGEAYEEGACNIYRPGHVAYKLHGNYDYMSDPRLNLVDIDGELFLEKTGNRPKCVSRWGEDGVYDMVGNLDEWIDDKHGVFLGGFSARQTKAGCDKKEPGHKPIYYDYSLGVRCCRDLMNLTLNTDRAPK